MMVRTSQERLTVWFCHKTTVMLRSGCPDSCTAKIEADLLKVYAKAVL
jgi:hypothetical protein